MGQVDDLVEDVRNEGLANGKRAVLVILFRQSGANIIETVNKVKAELPRLGSAMPTDVEINVASDRSVTIRASLRDTELTLLIAVVLVTAVMFLFLGDLRSTLDSRCRRADRDHRHVRGDVSAWIQSGQSVADGAHDLDGFRGRRCDRGGRKHHPIHRTATPGRGGAIKAPREVGFTVLSISISLIAVFIPIMLMGGIVGRMFREFAVVLSVAILSRWSSR